MWVSSNDYFLLIICCVIEQKKFCCIIIYYCDLKLKWINIVFILEIIKGLLNSLIQTPRENNASSWYK